MVRPTSFSRWLMMTLALALMTVLGGGAWFYRAQEQYLRHNIEVELQTIAQLKVNQIVSWRAERLADAAAFTDNSLFVEGVARALAPLQAEDAEKILQRFHSLREYSHYSDTLLVDVDGHILLSKEGALSGTNDNKNLIGAELRQTLAAAMRERRPMLTNLYRDADTQAPALSVIAPLFIQNKVTQPLGAVVLQIDPEQYFYPLIQSWPTPSRSAETLLVRRDGDGVLFLNNVRHLEKSALALRIDSSRTEVPAIKIAILGQAGVVQGKDYRGTEVVAVLAAIPNSPWFMVSKIDSEEVFAPWRLRALGILILIGSLIIAIVSAVGWIWQSRNRAHYQTLVRAAETLRASDQRFRGLFENAINGIAVHDIVLDEQGDPIDYVFLAANPAFETHMGLRVADVLGKRATAVIPGIGQTPLISIYGKVAIAGQPIHFEQFIASLRRHYSINAFQIGQGRFAVVFEDITERRQKAQMNEARLRSLLSIFQYQPETVQELLDYALGEAVKLTESKCGFLFYYREDRQELTLNARSKCALANPPSDRPQIGYRLRQAGLLGAAIQQRSPIIINKFQETLSPEKRLPEDFIQPLRYLAVPIFNAGHIVGTVGLSNKESDYDETDVLQLTLLMDAAWKVIERRRVDEALRESEQEYRTLADSGQALIWRAGTDRLCYYFNKVWLKFTGRTLEQEQGNGWMEGVHPDDFQRCLEIYAGAFDRRERFSMDYRLRRYDGQYLWIQDEGCPCYDSTGVFTGYIGYCLEITERKQAEERIYQLNADLEKRVIARTAQLEASNKELEAFAYSVSHDLRSPLRAIDGFSRILLEDYADKLDAEGHRLLNIVRTNAQQMDQLISDLLALSRTTRIEMQHIRVDMTALAQAVCQEVIAPNAQNPLSLAVTDLPDALGDPILLRQIWRNLLDNAVKYTRPKTAPHIEVGGYQETERNVYFVKDNGVGFNSAYAHKLFGVFQRLHKAEEFTGTGIGLAIVQRIVHRHGGQVWAEGTVNEGAAFYFSLPSKEIL